MNKRLLTVIFIAVFLISVGAYMTVNKTKGSVQKQEARVSLAAVQELYEQALALKEGKDLLKAKELLRQIVTEQPDFKEIDTVQKNLEEVNLKIIFSGIETLDTVVHEVKAGDTLGKIAKQYHTPIELIKRSNNLKGDTIRLGQKLRLWKGTFSVLVDKSQNILILSSNDEVMKVYRVSTGTDNNTPVGTFTIVNKLVDPVWFKSGAIIPPESPKNVLGSRWLGFDIPGYGIHGTVEPESIGQQVTAGCVRMLNEDVEELYSLLPVGTRVTIVD